MRYLIVGYGNIGHKRAEILGKQCVATIDTNIKIPADYKNSKDVPLEFFDAAILTVPQQAKYELTEYFLSKGKHVLIEKPLIITTKQGKHLLQLARKNNCIWYTSYNHRFEPNIIKIKQLLSKNTIGSLYYAKFVYSFGNIQERLGTWRETEYGVLEEIAPHIIDFANLFFGYKGKDFEPWIARKVESNIFDHWVFSTNDKKVIFETSSVSWKYVFSIDIYGQLGSIHMNSLKKWGGSELIIRKRILPSGVPTEKKELSQGPDMTWKEDFKFFEKMMLNKNTTLDSDLSTSQALAILALAAKPSKANSQQKIYKEILNEN